MAAKKLRFAVGSPAEYRSAIWIVSVQKNDVYLGARTVMTYAKLSLHASGIWRFAWSKESKIKAPGYVDRLMQRWRRSKEFYPGWTHGPAVFVPTTPIKRTFAHDPAQNFDDIVWIPTFSPGHQHQFTILFAAKNATTDSWNKVIPPSDRIIGTLDLRNGDKVVVCQRERTMEKQEAEYSAFLAKDTRIEYETTPKVLFASIFFPGTDKGGRPYIVDIALGWDNVFQRRRAPT